MIYLCWIEKSDIANALHDASGDCVMLVLWGSFKEFRYAYTPIEGIQLPPLVEYKRRFLSFIFYKAEIASRAELSEGPVLVLVLRRRDRRNAGFWAARLGDFGHQQFSGVVEGGNGAAKFKVHISYKGTLAHWVPTYFYKTEKKI